MVSEQLRQVALRSEGVGEFVGASTGSGSAEHPSCGDRVELSVQFSAPPDHSPVGPRARLAGVRWRASGCPATMAVAALAAKALVDVAVGDAADVLRRAIAAHGGLAAHERHAEAIVLRALAAASGA
jgi:NifU-like protein involved in Fe-S cluster formation